MIQLASRSQHTALFSCSSSVIIVIGYRHQTHQVASSFQEYPVPVLKSTKPIKNSHDTWKVHYRHKHFTFNPSTQPLLAVFGVSCWAVSCQPQAGRPNQNLQYPARQMQRLPSRLAIRHDGLCSRPLWARKTDPSCFAHRQQEYQLRRGPSGAVFGQLVIWL